MATPKKLPATKKMLIGEVRIPLLAIRSFDIRYDKPTLREERGIDVFKNRSGRMTLVVDLGLLNQPVQFTEHICPRKSSRLLKRAEFLKAVCEKEGVEWLPKPVETHGEVLFHEGLRERVVISTTAIPQNWKTVEIHVNREGVCEACNGPCRFFMTKKAERDIVKELCRSND